MADEFRKILSAEPEIPLETREIQSSTAPFVALPETIGDKLNACRPFVNDGLNSRLAQNLPVGNWTIRTSADLQPGTRPKHLLHTSDRIIIQGDGPWQLFDNEGNLLARGYLDGSDAVIDAENNLFYFSDAAGMIEARNLDDGNRAFSASLLFGHAYTRSFIVRRNAQMIIVSIERELDQDAEEKPQDSTIEVLQFNEPPKIDQDGILRSSEITADLIRKTLWLLSAVHDETLVVAAENQICLFDFNLQLKTVINGEFMPNALSLSSAGLIYSVIRDETGLKLWCLNSAGERFYETALPEEIQNIYRSPIIGNDLRVYLIWNNRLLAFNPNGEFIWEFKSAAPIAGAAITADNQLLLASGAEIVVFDADGNYRTLYDFETETLQTPPTMTANGEIVVASDKKLYYLKLKPEN